MTTPPRLTDARLLALHRARAAAAPEPFLTDRIALDLQERLEAVNRTFTAPAIVTGLPGAFPDLLPGAPRVADTPTLDLVPVTLQGLDDHSLLGA